MGKRGKDERSFRDKGMSQVRGEERKGKKVEIKGNG